MKRAALIATLVASLATGSAALADGRDHDRDHHRDSGWARHGQVYRGDRHDDRAYRGGYRGERDYRHDYRGDRRDFRWAPQAREWNRQWNRSPGWYGGYHRPHGYYSHRWLRGERLPVTYYSRSYVIDDYRDCGLRVPPRGYHWVRVDGDAVLAAVATGIVLDTVLHVFD
jgi:Ni/Co efflux regulator RcnB